MEQALKEASLGESTLKNWKFEVVGNPPKKFIATSTQDFAGGEGKQVWYDVTDAKFHGYGIDTWTNPETALAAIGQAVGRFAAARGYTLIRNLASHGTGRALHEAPEELATWPTRGDRRKMHRGMVFTVEPFLSLGGHHARQGSDGWTLFSHPPAPVVQYEHTVVTTARGALIVTRPDQP